MHTNPRVCACLDRVGRYSRRLEGGGSRDKFHIIKLLHSTYLFAVNILASRAYIFHLLKILSPKHIFYKSYSPVHLHQLHHLHRSRFPPSFIHQQSLSGLNKLYDCMFSPWRWPQMPTGRKTPTQTQNPNSSPVIKPPKNLLFHLLLPLPLHDHHLLLLRVLLLHSFSSSSPPSSFSYIPSLSSPFSLHKIPPGLPCMLQAIWFSLTEDKSDAYPTYPDFASD